MASAEDDAQAIKEIAGHVRELAAEIKGKRRLSPQAAGTVELCREDLEQIRRRLEPIAARRRRRLAANSEQQTLDEVGDVES